VNKNKCDLIYGSIFSIPRQNKSFSGIYNLGVMEHFTEIEIKKILKEFRRVLKNNGKIILFWPHEYALSVIFLKFVHYVSNNLFQMKLKLHPDEITRIHSKKQAELILKNSGFDLVYYSFCFKDFFTHAVLVGKKN
jgi:ubiquinone/menaquinone biosynthesis C-methylase UbiE